MAEPTGDLKGLKNIQNPVFMAFPFVVKMVVKLYKNNLKDNLNKIIPIINLTLQR